MKKHKKRFLHGAIFMVIILSAFFFAADIAEITFAVMTQNTPDVVITINGDGSITQEGNLFGEGLWYPDKQQSGVIRIHNRFKTIDISNLGLEVDLTSFRSAYNEDSVFTSFLDNMHLLVKRGHLFSFNQNILDKISFEQLLHIAEDGSANGFFLKPSDQFRITKNSTVDLKYTLQMDKDAGKELQGLTAVVSFLINAHESPVVVVKPTNGKKDDSSTPKHWAHDCIQTLIKHGVIEGYPDGSIKPEQQITRAEAAVIVGRALDLEEKSKLLTGYIDFIPNWARGHIISTTDAKIFHGYPGFLFKSNQHITREEMAKVLMIAFEREAPEDTELEFEDKEDISKWALPHVKAGVSHSIIVGYPDKTFKPSGYITRAEAFTMICKLMGLHEEHE